MERSAMFDSALERMLGDIDDVEGKSAMSHGMDECPDPLTCGQHDQEAGDSLASPDGGGVTIEVKKLGMPSMDGGKDEPSLDDKGEEGQGLSEEDAAILRKLLKG